MIYFDTADDFVSAVKEYVESYVALGYTPYDWEEYAFIVYSETELFEFKCNANGYCSVDISILK